ncbi:universal stress protein [Sphaerisporangium perillae]|uniref:universal stress protein n=1 Tax=Sphaerisporangium perillae TaxID=2935860 RepID=UPI00200ECA5F|nr:universal stress protein [Sphaerisporangium perillae]
MIVAGVDGSEAGLEAARWAAKEAALRGTALRLVHAMPAWACEAEEGPYAEVARWMRDGADTVLNEALEQVRQVAPDIEVTTERLPGDPRPALIKASEGAELLAVGNHGLGGFRGLLLGSVALGVAGRARCPVAVVRPLPAGARPQIVVGIDGADSDVETLRFAFAEAGLRRAHLVVVHAKESLPGPAEAEQGQPVSGTLREWLERHPDVKVREHGVPGHPVEVLLQAASQAELLVVGSRGRGGFSGLVLGSVSHGLLHHAPCPVVVLPTGRRD